MCAIDEELGSGKKDFDKKDSRRLAAGSNLSVWTSYMLKAMKESMFFKVDWDGRWKDLSIASEYCS